MIDMENITNNLGVRWVLIFFNSWLVIVVDCVVLSINNINNARIGNPSPILNMYISMGSNDFNRYCLATIVVMAHASPDIKAN